MKRTNITLELVSVIGVNTLAAGANIAVLASGSSGMINWIAAILASFMSFVLIWHAASASKESKQGSSRINTNLYFSEDKKFGDNNKHLA